MNELACVKGGQRGSESAGEDAIEDLETSPESNAEYLESVFRSLGYFVLLQKVSPTHYGSPQQRSRMYILVFKMATLDNLRSHPLRASMCETFEAVKIEMRPLAQYVLKPDDPRIHRWQAAMVRRHATGERYKWMGLHMQMFSQAGLEWPHNAKRLPPAVVTYLGRRPWVTLQTHLTERGLDALMYWLQVMDLSQYTAADVEGSVDLYHSLDRQKPVSHFCKIVLPHSEIYWLNAGRMAIPEEKFLVQGFDLCRAGIELDPEGPWGLRDLSDYAGNGFCGSCLCVSLLVLLGHAGHMT